MSQHVHISLTTVFVYHQVHLTFSIQTPERRHARTSTIGLLPTTRPSTHSGSTGFTPSYVSWHVLFSPTQLARAPVPRRPRQ